jgi:hypothetical protein
MHANSHVGKPTDREVVALPLSPPSLHLITKVAGSGTAARVAQADMSDNLIMQQHTVNGNATLAVVAATGTAAWRAHQLVEQLGGSLVSCWTI